MAVSPPEVADWILIEVSPFQQEAQQITQVVGINRYQSTQQLFTNLLSNEMVTMNLFFARDGHALNKETLLTELTEQTQFGFLIGTVNKVTA